LQSINLNPFRFSYGNGFILDVPERIAAECGYCERFNKYTFAKTLWPSDFKKTQRRSFNCFSCGEMSVCGKSAFKSVDHIKHDKDLKEGLLLYDETGVSTETTIGRFTFKIKGD